MRPSRWFRNLPMKIGALVATGLATLGFYTLIQAQGTTTRTDNATGATATASATTGQPGVSAPPTVAPIQRQAVPMPRRRTSRGS